MFFVGKQSSWEGLPKVEGGQRHRYQEVGKCVACPPQAILHRIEDEGSLLEDVVDSKNGATLPRIIEQLRVQSSNLSTLCIVSGCR